MNLTRDFPYVWDEITQPVGNRSDMDYAARVLLDVAKRVLGDQMAGPAEQYEWILAAARLEGAIAPEPQGFLSLDDSWTNVSIRYLVPARERRRWQSELANAIITEMARPEHEKRIIGVFPPAPDPFHRAGWKGDRGSGDSSFGARNGISLEGTHQQWSRQAG